MGNTLIDDISPFINADFARWEFKQVGQHFYRRVNFVGLRIIWIRFFEVDWGLYDAFVRAKSYSLRNESWKSLCKSGLKYISRFVSAKLKFAKSG
jgi:hypothetical protein